MQNFTETFAATFVFWALSLLFAGVCFWLPPGAPSPSTGQTTCTMPEAITALMSLASFFIGVVTPIAIAGCSSD